MLEQSEANRLISTPKLLTDKGILNFPSPNDSLTLTANSEDGRERFIFYVNRKGARIKVTKCSYVERYANVEELVRLDVDGPPHTNPDGERIACPHIHIYKEGFGLRWAKSISPKDFADTSDLEKVLLDFLLFCKIQNCGEVSFQRSIE